MRGAGCELRGGYRVKGERKKVKGLRRKAQGLGLTLIGRIRLIKLIELIGLVELNAFK